MQTNVIVMTAGLAGSSVLTGLLARAGYWTGHETHRKAYDTFENKRLIELNGRLFDEVGFDGDYTMRFPGWVVEAIDQRAAEIDPAPYKEFLADCERHAPWVWKDPRLTFTIRAWARWMDLGRVKFLLISRENLQGWISITLRRQIHAYDAHKFLNERVRQSIEDFLRIRSLDCLPIVYEDLIIEPDETIARINAFLGTSLARADLEATFAGRLERRQHGPLRLAKALAIYLKNYRSRETLAVRR